MKLIIASIVLLLVQPFGRKTKLEYPSPPSQCTVVLFLDASKSTKSADWDKEDMNVLGKFLHNTYYKNKLGVVSGYGLHQTTSGLELFRSSFTRHYAPCNSTYDSKKKCMQVEEGYKKYFGGKMATVRKGIKQQLLHSNNERIGNWTNIWGALHAMNREFEGAEEKVVVFISDMKQSMPAPGRNFDKVAPRSMAEAQQWAQEDIPKIEAEFGLTQHHLHGTKVVIVTPSSSKDEPSMIFIREYWDTVFGSFGLGRMKTYFPA